MTKIRKIEINDFRGFDGLQTFEFDDAELIVFLGMNGFGKTSIFDAVEWCLTGHLGRYERYLEAGRKQDFTKEKEILRNKYSSNPNTHVKVYLSNEKKFGRRVAIGDSSSDYNTGSIIDGFEYGVKSISNQEMDPTLIHNYFSATHILSQETINHFVTSKKPEDRYRALSVNFGTSLYDPFGDNAQNLLTTFRDQEDKLKIRYIEHNKHLTDLRSQIQVKTNQIEEQLKDANQLVTELNGLSPDFKLGKYILDAGKIVSKENAKEDLHNLVSLIRTAIEELQNKIVTTRSLSQDYSNWVVQNKELEGLDKQIIENKQQLLKFKELQANALHFKKETVALDEALAKDATELNIARDVKSSLSNFLKAKEQIEKLSGDISSRNSLAKENQTLLSSIAEVLLKAEQEIKSVNEQILEIDAIMLTVADQLQKNQASAQLEEEIRKATSAITTAQVQKALLRRVEIIVDGNFDIVDEIITDSFLKLAPSLDPHLFTKAVSKKNRASAIPNSIQAINLMKSSLESEYSRKTKELSKKIGLLVNAQELIDSESPKSHCPVCEDVHDTATLLASIISRIEDTHSNELERIKSEITQCNKDIGTLNIENSTLLTEIATLKLTIKEASLLINTCFDKAIEAGLTSQQQCNVKLQQIEEERHRLLARLTSVLNQQVNDLDVGKSLCESLALNLGDRRNKLKSQVEVKNKEQIELTKQLHSRLDENRIAQQQIDVLRSAAYQGIEKYVVEKGFAFDTDILTQIMNHIEKREEIYSQTKTQAQTVTNRKMAVELELIAFRVGRTELQIENDNIKAASRITEISRFLSDYKERCFRVGLDLGDVSAQLFMNVDATLTLTLEQKSKIIDLLGSLAEKSKDFIIFNNEDSFRKKIDQLEIESNTINNQIKRVQTAKEKIDTLKKDFPKVIEQYIKKNLDVGLFNKIYNSLNPHRRFKNIDFLVNVSHNKVGISFNAKHSKVTARPEFLFSSAQLNTFGVSMFLSMALRQNWLNLDTVLLDDPIQNLDDINILSLIDLIRGLLDLKSGKQVVMSTHDERFYNLIKRKFTGYKLKAYKFESYGRVTPDLA